MITHVGKGVRKEESLSTVVENVNACTREISVEASRNLKIEQPYDTATPFLSKCPTELHISPQRYHTPMFIAVLFTRGNVLTTVLLL